MISLKLHYGPAFTPLTKKTDEELTFNKELKLNELFEFFYEKYGDGFKEILWDKNNIEEFHKQLVIIINGRTYRDDNFLYTPLKDGDDLFFLYVYFGG